MLDLKIKINLFYQNIEVMNSLTKQWYKKINTRKTIYLYYTYDPESNTSFNCLF